MPFWGRPPWCSWCDVWCVLKLQAEMDPRRDPAVLVIHDAAGFNETAFRHNKRFAELGAELRRAASVYCDGVRSGAFPGEANVFRMHKAELAALENAG